MFLSEKEEANSGRRGEEGRMRERDKSMAVKRGGGVRKVRTGAIWEVW